MADSRGLGRGEGSEQLFLRGLVVAVVESWPLAFVLSVACWMASRGSVACESWRYIRSNNNSRLSWKLSASWESADILQKQQYRVLLFHIDRTKTNQIQN